MRGFLKALYIMAAIFLGFYARLYIVVETQREFLSGLVMIAVFYGSYLLYKKLFKSSSTPKQAAAAPDSAAKAQPAVQSNPVSAPPKAAPAKTATASSKYTFSDFFSALLMGVLIGLIPRLLIGILAGMASLSHDSANAALFRTVGNIALLICVVVVTPKRLKTVRAERLQQESRRAYLAETEKRLRETLPREMAIIRQGFRHDSPESLERYGRACDNLIHDCSWYCVNEKSLDHIVEPYRKECYSRTFPFVDWRNGKWTYIPGTELAEEIRKSTDQYAKEWQENMNRKLHIK